MPTLRVPWESQLRALDLSMEDIGELLLPGEFFAGATVNAVFSWRDGKFYEAELLIRNVEEFTGSSVRVETRTRKHLGTAMRRMLALRHGPRGQSGVSEPTESHQ
jgi:hypothetical protein